MIERTTPSPIENGLTKEARLANINLQILQTRMLLKSLHAQREAILGETKDRYHQEHSNCYPSQPLPRCSGYESLTWKDLEHEPLQPLRESWQQDNDLEYQPLRESISRTGDY